MLNKKVTSLMLVVGCMLSMLPKSGLSQGAASGEVSVSANKQFKLELLSPLSTATNKKNDSFSCRVLEPSNYAGATVSGRIRGLKSSGKVKGDSKMELEFQRIDLPDGRSGRFNAQVKEVYDVVDAAQGGKADSEGLVKGKSTVKRDVLKITTGALIGALIGGLLGGPKGAVAGAIIGGGVATASTLSTKGPNLEFKQGTQFVVLTNAPPNRNKDSRSKEVNTSPPRPAVQPSAIVADTSATASPTVSGAPQPGSVQPPSSLYRTFRSNGFYHLNVPDNWREFGSGNTLTLAPEGSYGVYQGKPGFTHGVFVGVVPASSRDLRQSTDALVGGLLRTNTYLRQQGTYASSAISNRNSLIANLAGRWPATDHDESLTVFTAMMRNGKLFYLVTVVPQTDSASYYAVFQAIVHSIKFED
jgi:hypothetical protein